MTEYEYLLIPIDGYLLFVFFGFFFQFFFFFFNLEGNADQRLNFRDKGL